MGEFLSDGDEVAGQLSKNYEEVEWVVRTTWGYG